MASSVNSNADRGSAVTAIFWVQGSVAILIVFARFYARKLIRAIGADDWWMFLTLVSDLDHTPACRVRWLIERNSWTS